MKRKIICGILSLGIIFQPINVHNINAYTKINESNLLKVGMKNQSIIALQQNLKELGYFNYKVTGYYGNITKQAVIKFQKSNNLVSDGIAGPNTIHALNKGQNKSTALVVSRGADRNSVLNWSWFSKIERAVPRGSIVKVTDIYTGKSFQAKRTYGTNHADMENLTKEDTAILKNIYGNKWSWERRPIIVEYNGLSIPASMSGMPHAGNDNAPSTTYTSWRSGGYGGGANLDAVKGNNMDGHFDIHFLGSKTHGSNKIDSKHQEAVKIARKYLSK
ncbi:peptidoglycan-binding domain-containing protein [Tepidibacter formicigenes]|jgi:peptidoglycan hydrolase-like protein with peptidoglycan-binding domain|uniref:Putative peptidoglycan binding domain-containing protein n=1 Tax=Tepidibacter formicigenes DSM 15518 TaxID=1123349 RepID=A0A1M6PFF6_9FIRM|nr:peptidoglycan-binding domain-containing protein [Tepidibacter formicigenes]SHK06686.1 Putative peptidoglycan binding domain-containing protein [Tepidibacter formicigenes DSM 15518]